MSVLDNVRFSPTFGSERFVATEHCTADYNTQYVTVHFLNQDQYCYKVSVTSSRSPTNTDICIDPKATTVDLNCSCDMYCCCVQRT